MSILCDEKKDTNSKVVCSLQFMFTDDFERFFMLAYECQRTCRKCSFPFLKHHHPCIVPKVLDPLFNVYIEV